MSIGNIVKLFELVAGEQKIVFISSHLQMLTLASETVCSWMFPFNWHHILIPVLPARLLNYLQAPVPYIMGVHRSYFHSSIMDDAMPTDVNFPYLGCFGGH
jgi:DENN (AEX-3) domain